MIHESKQKDIIIKADSLAEAYAMAFEEVGSEFDVLEIKKVAGGAFGSTSIQIRVSPVNRKKKEEEKVVEKKMVEKSEKAEKIKKVEEVVLAPVKEKVKKVVADASLKASQAVKKNSETLSIAKETYNEQALVLKKSKSAELGRTVLKMIKNNDDFNSKAPVLKKVVEFEKRNEEKKEKVFVQKEKKKSNWESAVAGLREVGFNESNIVKMLSEIKTTKKHLKLKPLSLIENRLTYHCVSEAKTSKTINVLFSKPSLSASYGISAYLFSKYAKQGLTSNKIVLTNSVSDLKNVLGKDFLKILRVELLQVDQAQDWLSSSSLILSQTEVCCVFFQQNPAIIDFPDIPDAMGAITYTKLIQWSEAISETEVELLKECKAQLFVTGLEENSVGSLLKPSLDLEIPTEFVLRGKDFLSGLIHSSDLIKEVVQEITEEELEASINRKAG